MLRVDNAKLERMLSEVGKNIHPQTRDSEATLIQSEMTLRMCSLEEDNKNLRLRLQELLDREAKQEQTKTSIMDLHERLRKLLEDSEEKQSIIFRLSEEAETLRVQASLAKQYQDSTERLLHENQNIAEVLYEVREKLKPNSNMNMLSSNNQELKHLVEALKSDLDRSERSLRELSERHRVLQSSYASKSAEASQLEVLLAENQRLSEGYGELKGLNTLLTREKEQLQTELAQYRSFHNEKTSDLENRCFRAEGLVQTLKSRIEELINANTGLVKDLELANSKAKSIAQLEDRLRLAESERDSLRRVCDDLKSHHQSASSELSELKKQSLKFIGLEQQFASQGQELRTLQAVHENMEAKCKSLQQQVAVLESECSQSKRDRLAMEKLCEEQSLTITDLQKLKAYKGEVTDRDVKIRELEQKIETQLGQVRGLLDANTELRMKLVSSQTSGSSSTLANLPAEDSHKLRCLLQQLDTEYTLSKQREIELKANLSSLEGKLRGYESTEGELQRQRQENLQLRTENEELRTENRKMKAHSVYDRSELRNSQNLEAELRVLQVDLSAKDVALQDAQKRIQILEAELNRTLNDTKNKLGASLEDQTRLTEENSYLKNLLNKQKSELNEIHEKLSQLKGLESSHSDQKAELQGLIEEKNQLERQVEQLQHERNSMLQKFDLRLKQIESDRTGSIQTESVLREELQLLRTQTQQYNEELMSLRNTELLIPF